MKEVLAIEHRGVTYAPGDCVYLSPQEGFENEQTRIRREKRERKGEVKKKKDTQRRRQSKTDKEEVDEEDDSDCDLSGLVNEYRKRILGEGRRVKNDTNNRAKQDDMEDASSDTSEILTREEKEQARREEKTKHWIARITAVWQV